MTIDRGGTYGGILEMRKTHVSDDFWGYLEHKTLNMYGSMFQKDPPPWQITFLTVLAFVRAVIAVGAL